MSEQKPSSLNPGKIQVEIDFEELHRCITDATERGVRRATRMTRFLVLLILLSIPLFFFFWFGMGAVASAYSAAKTHSDMADLRRKQTEEYDRLFNKTLDGYPINAETSAPVAEPEPVWDASKNYPPSYKPHRSKSTTRKPQPASP